jgi:methionine-gamma-lyase
MARHRPMQAQARYNATTMEHSMNDLHGNFGPGTQAIHAGQDRDATGSVMTPIYQTSTFAFDSVAQGAARFAGEDPGYIYTRLGNPTIRALEDNLTMLEGGARGLACASGMAAVNTLYFALLGQGAHLAATDALYGASRTVMEQHWSRFGVEHSFVDTANLDALEAAMRPNTRLVFIETPANPNLKVSDIADCAEIAHRHGALLAVDNTFMSPILQRPFEHGADIVLHSVTKFINGHSDVVGGVLISRTDDLDQRLRPVWASLGGTMDPHQAWLVLRGVKTLKLRVLAAQANAQQLAQALAAHPKVAWVAFPGLPGFPGAWPHYRQASGPGSLISFELKDGLAAGERLLNAVKLMALAVSLGGVETLIQHPASMTHHGMSRESRLAAGISDGLVRLSVGCEDIADLEADLLRALEQV